MLSTQALSGVPAQCAFDTVSKGSRDNSLSRTQGLQPAALRSPQTIKAEHESKATAAQEATWHPLCKRKDNVTSMKHSSSWSHSQWNGSGLELTAREQRRPIPAIWRYGAAFLSVAAAYVGAKWLQDHYGFEPFAVFICAMMWSGWFGGINPNSEVQTKNRRYWLIINRL
jgi:hypothetical protein